MFLFVLMIFAFLEIQTATKRSMDIKTTHQDDIICNGKKTVHFNFYHNYTMLTDLTC